MKTTPPIDTSAFPIERRVALKWMLAAAASAALFDPPVFATGEARAGATGYGTDPDLTRTYRPGDVWPLTLDAGQRRLAAVLCDVILPADDLGPAASSVGVPDFIDEWISAPYPDHGDDRRIILDGLVWIDAESNRRFGAGFERIAPAQRAEICDDIQSVKTVKPDLADAAKFFDRFRRLTTGGYYTTPAGMEAIGYVGNIPLVTFDGPPSEVIAKLGLD